MGQKFILNSRENCGVNISFICEMYCTVLANHEKNISVI